MTRYSTEGDTDHRDSQDWDRALGEADLQQRTELARRVRSSVQQLADFLLDNTISVELVGLDANREFDLERLIAEVTRSETGSRMRLAAPGY